MDRHKRWGWIRKVVRGTCDGGLTIWILTLFLTVPALAQGTGESPASPACDCDTPAASLYGMEPAALLQCQSGVEAAMQRVEEAKKAQCINLINAAYVRRTLLTTAQAAEELILDHAALDDYFFKFRIGYEYTSVDKLFETGLPQVGLLVYRQYSDRFALTGDFLLTSSAEQATRVDTGGVSAESRRSLAFEVQPTYYFHNMYLRMRSASAGQQTRRLQERLGLTARLGASKIDDQTTLNHRIYLGIRAAINPQMYVELLGGRTEGLRSRRMELRAQMPIFKLAAGDRFYLGGSANFGVGADMSEADAMKIYIAWDLVDFSKLFFGK